MTAPRTPGKGPRRASRQQRVGRPPRGARGAAYDLLHAVAADDAYANLVWPTILADARLDARDAGFATELAYGTLRWRGLYDEVLTRCVDRPLDKLDGRVLDLLRLGTHQILSMRVPEHAAVSETVALTRQVAGEGPAKLVNAVLRRVIDGGDRDAWIAKVAPGDSRDELAIATSHPRWIITAFAEALAAHRGAPDPEGLRAVLAADNAPASPVLVARDVSPEDLQNLPGVQPGRWSPLAATLVDGRPEELPLVRSGAVGVQDEGSQLVALALAAVPVEGRDQVWVDLAAGPGGKAALLAREVGRRGGRLIAVEQHPHRAELVRHSLPPGAHEVLVADGRKALPAATADRTLIDAPCTGIGALRRRPEARWRRSPGDLATLGPLQRELLDAAIALTRPGGVIGYSTCSPHMAETDLVVTDALRRRGDVEMIDARAYLPDVPDLGPGPAVRLWPHLHGTDGMYLALLRRL
ncbi:MAG: RsmB/NOP family class I SAM-dependent RNA methyltransferase [Candidatus Nanopelagicales bacterium]